MRRTFAAVALVLLVLLLAFAQACEPPTAPPPCPVRLPTTRGDTLSISCDTLRGVDPTPSLPKRPR